MTAAEKNSPEVRAADAFAAKYLAWVVVIATVLCVLTVGSWKVLALEVSTEANRQTAQFIVKQLADDRAYRRCIEWRHTVYTAGDVAWFTDLLAVEKAAAQHSVAWYNEHRLKAFEKRLSSVVQTAQTNCGDDGPKK